ncbi:MAG: hypothetical protein AAB799_01360 [Patescibacteria group bacterium]
MRKEVFEAALKSTIPESATLSGINLQTSSGRSKPVWDAKLKYKEPLESGTTVLAFYFKNGLVLAGDRQTSGWFTIISQESVKVHQVGFHAGFMFAGMVSDGQAVVKSLQRVDQDFIERFGVPLSLDGKANFLCRFMRLHYDYGIFLEAWGIIAGLNYNPPTFEIYSVEPTGAKMASNDFATTGSGMEKAESELERFKGKIIARSLEETEAVELAVRAIYMAGKKDMGTSDVRLAVPVVAIITLKEGFRFVNQTEVQKVRDKLIEEERRKGNVV